MDLKITATWSAFINCPLCASWALDSLPPLRTKVRCLPRPVFLGSARHSCCTLYTTSHRLSYPWAVLPERRDDFRFLMTWERKATLASSLDVPFTLSTMRQDEICQQLVPSSKGGCEQSQNKDQLLVQEQPGSQSPSNTASAGAWEMQTTSRFWNAAFLLRV